MPEIVKPPLEAEVKARIRRTQKRKLERIAREWDCDLSDVLRRAFAMLLDSHAKEKDGNGKA